jgi:hypothetical protein
MGAVDELQQQVHILVYILVHSPNQIPALAIEREADLVVSTLGRAAIVSTLVGRAAIVFAFPKHAQLSVTTA